jgi:RNA polymerase sigma-70 factor (ECF subfamily)
VFDTLKIVLTSGKGGIAFARLAGELGMTEPATRMAASRLRQRYRELVRREIAHTVSRPEEIEGELRHLFVVLGR